MSTNPIGSLRSMERRAIVRTPTDRRLDRGFTLVELLLVILIVAIIAVIGLPALQNMIQRSKTEGFARNLAKMSSQARLEAVKRNQEAIVRMESADTRFRSFVDVNDNDAFDNGTDIELRTLSLPSFVSFRGPGGPPAYAGFVNNNANPDAWAEFLPNGSVESIGAFRIADARDNFLEVRVEPQATGKTTLRKWNGSDWTERDEGDWKWK